MNEHLVKMAVAFALGTGATAGIIRLLAFLPVPGYIKRILGIVVPLPVILVALVMLYYGPGAVPGQDEALPASTGALRRMFFYGIFTPLGYFTVAGLIRFLLRKTSDEDEAGD
jgi:hypothetical protein